jgi:hypothetical protein
MASTEGKVNNALDPCDIPCVPEFRKNTNLAVKKACDASLVTNSLCFVEKDVEKAFYDAIQWTTLKDNLSTYMAYFIEELNQDTVLPGLLQTVYKFGPVPNQQGATIKRFGRLGFTIPKNPNFTFCDNIIIKITLSSGKRQQDLAHISLHSKLPVYYRDTRRSRSGCGYFKRTANANAFDEDKLGPFHYQIDTLFWKFPSFNSSSKNVPFVRYEPDPANPGFFLRPHTNFRGNISKYPFESDQERRLPQDMIETLKEQAKETTIRYFKNQGKSLKGEGEAALMKSDFSKKEKEILQNLKAEALEKGYEDPNTKGYTGQTVAGFIENLNLLHTRISLKFLEFWNGKMVTGLVERANENRPGYTGFPSILRSKQSGLASRSSSGNSVSSKERLPTLKDKLPGALKDKPVILSASELGANKAVYTGFFLPNDAAYKLFVVVNEILAKQDPEFQHRAGYTVQAGHLTMQFGNEAAQIFERIKALFPENPIGLSIRSIVYGKINGKPLVAVKVHLPEELASLSENPNPHITVYHDPSVKPVMSNELLKDSPPAFVTDKNEIPFEMELPASAGIFVSVARKGGTRKAKRYILRRKSRTHKHK